MKIDLALLEVLACPCEHHAPIEPDAEDLAEATALVCIRCRTSLPGPRRHPGDAARRGDPGPTAASARDVRAREERGREHRGRDQGGRRRDDRQRRHRGHEVPGLRGDRVVSSMLSEAIHSVADTCNQGLLLHRRQALAARAGRGAPVRLRPDPLRLRVHRRDHHLPARRAVLPLRGVAQVPPPRAAGEGLDRLRRSWSSRSCWRPGRSGPRCARRTSRAASKSLLRFVREARQPELPDGPAGGRRCAGRPGASRCSASPWPRRPATAAGTASAPSRSAPCW